MIPASQVAELFGGTAPQEGSLARQAQQGGEDVIDPDAVVYAPGRSGPYREVRAMMMADGPLGLQAGGSRARSRKRKQRGRKLRDRKTRRHSSSHARKQKKRN
jgi:hypothetical protein